MTRESADLVVAAHLQLGTKISSGDVRQAPLEMCEGPGNAATYHQEAHGEQRKANRDPPDERSAQSPRELVERRLLFSQVLIAYALGVDNMIRQVTRKGVGARQPSLCSNRTTELQVGGNLANRRDQLPLEGS